MEVFWKLLDNYVVQLNELDHFGIQYNEWWLRLWYLILKDYHKTRNFEELLKYSSYLLELRNKSGDISFLDTWIDFRFKI